MKTIAQPRYVISPRVHLHHINPVSADEKDYFLGTVKEDFKPVEYDVSGSRDVRVNTESIVVHHYMYRSEEEALMKSTRARDAWIEPDEVKILRRYRNETFFSYVQGKNTIQYVDIPGELELR